MQANRFTQAKLLIRIAAGGALALLFSGCGGSSATIKPLGTDAVVVAFGDSLTSGKGAADSDTYPSILANLTGYTVINAGHSGERTEAGLERLPSVLREHRPNLVILCHGGNDMLQKVNRDETISNLDAMVAMIQQSGADVILVGVPEPGIFLNPAPFYEQLAERHAIPFDVETVARILGDGALKSDHIHPNANGYRKLAEAVATVIDDSQSA